jgi:dTDP-4-amino-4,6-dideoxygalactose transaminase
MSFIPIARPRLPKADALLPYLRRIDEHRTYSNFGPLVSELESRLADRLGVDPSCLVTVSNATSGLTLALQSVVPSSSGICLMPSWTFVATAHAVTAAGFTPYLVDVDESSWALTPAIALEAIARIARPVTAVMPVAPFGAPMDVAAWDRFNALTGIPVVIDAAAGHDTVRPGDAPAVVSLHATKILGAGEGGYVVCNRPDIIVGVRQRSNFGFYGSRNAERVAQNAKMSEYHAAVGLASMDRYDIDLAGFRETILSYRAFLADRADISFQPGFGDQWCGSVIVARFQGGDEARIAAHCRESRVDSRLWWGKGVHRQAAFCGAPQLPLGVTETLAHETLGLPLYTDMAEQDVATVCNAIKAERHVRSVIGKAA